MKVADQNTDNSDNLNSNKDDTTGNKDTIDEHSWSSFLTAMRKLGENATSWVQERVEAHSGEKSGGTVSDVPVTTAEQHLSTLESYRSSSDRRALMETNDLDLVPHNTDSALQTPMEAFLTSDGGDDPFQSRDKVLQTGFLHKAGFSSAV